MNLDELRSKHPGFIYDSYSYKKERNNLVVSFRFIIEPDIVFNPKVIIPVQNDSQIKKIDDFVFNLGLIESLSYWKATCSPNYTIRAGFIDEYQTYWWHSLFIKGLGEFYFKNNIDFTGKDFLKFKVEIKAKSRENSNATKKGFGDLILVGGGKDSVVSLELLKQIKTRKLTAILNAKKPSLKIIQEAGYENPILIQRIIDPKLLKLNSTGYLNGHTPFSAYLAFIGVLLAYLYGFKNLIVSNEKSSDENNTIFKNSTINHQYSKTFEFELLFRKYTAEYVDREINYFSLLRPLYDLQISKMFAKYPKYFKSFLSCNVGQKNNITWCGNCAKCASVYMSLYPFLGYKEMIRIFGQDYFLKKELKQYFYSLVGLGKYKPFECVGTIDESILSIYLGIRAYENENKKIPEILLILKRKLEVKQKIDIDDLENRILNDWGKNFLPREYEKLLKNEYEK